MSSNWLDDLLAGNEAQLATAPPPALGSATTGTAARAAREDHTHAHGSLAGGSAHALATSSAHGFLSASGQAGIISPATSTLSDADHTVSVAGSRRLRHASLTTARKDTIDATGATQGDALCIVREDGSINPLTIDVGNGDKIRAMVPGSYGIRHDGSRFRFENHVRHGEAVLFATDFFNDDLSRVIGDGVTDCITGINRAIAAVSKTNGAARLHFPAGVYAHSAQIRFVGNANSVGGMHVSGDAASLGGAGTVFLYTGPDLTTEAAIKCVGLAGSHLHHFFINCNGKASRGLWLSLETVASGGDESGAMVDVDHVNVGVLLDAVDGFGFGWGPDSPVNASTDVPFVRFNRCRVTDNSGIRRTYSSGFKSNQNANTKDATLVDCIVEDCLRGLDLRKLSGVVTWGGGASYFGNCGTDIDKDGAGTLVVIGANTEGSDKALNDGASADPSITSIQGWNWNGQCDDNGCVITSNGSLTVRDSSFQNGRLANAVASFSTSANTITLVGSVPKSLAVGMRVRFVKLTGSTSSFPTELAEGTDYYIKTVSAGTNPSMTLSKTSGGSTVAFGAGTVSDNGLHICAVTTVQMNDPNLGTVHTGNAAEFSRVYFSGAYGTLDVFGSSYGSAALTAQDSNATAPPQLTITDCWGGDLGSVRKLRNFDGRLREVQELKPRLLTSGVTVAPVPLQVLQTGVPGHCDSYLLDWSFLKREFGGSTTYTMYVQAPSLAFVSGNLQQPEMAVEWVVLDVLAAFTGAGLTSFKVFVGDFDSTNGAGGTGKGSLLGAGATGISCLTTGKKGRTAAELGADFTTGANVVMGAHYCGTNSLLRIDIEADVAWSNLTAGKAILRIKRRVASP